MADEEVRQLNDPEFDAAMAKLVEVAASSAPPEAGDAAAAAGRTALPDVRAAVAEAVEPLETSLHVLGRRCELIAETAARIESAAAGLAAVPAALENLRQAVERRAGEAESARGLIDALHQEMRGYKDAFLLEVILKPVLKDLISLHDDLDGIRQRLERLAGAFAEAGGGQSAAAPLAQECQNLAHAVDYLVEILARSDVERLPQSSGPADKTVVKIVRVTPSADPALDGVIESSLRRGFSWRGRPFRPEEVSVWRAARESAPDVSEA